MTKVFVSLGGIFFRKGVFRKRLSGRTIELDKIIESEHDEQSSAASKMVSVAATMFTAHVSAKCCSLEDQNNY